jgi:hypothetical protein
VGNGQHEAVFLCGRLAEKLHHGRPFSLSSEEVGSSQRMIGRVVHKGACDGDALLLAPDILAGRKSAWPVSPTHSRTSRAFFSARRDEKPWNHEQARCDVLRRGERGDQVDLLEDEAEVARAELGDRVPRILRAAGRALR